jgi:hypothetical protein
MNQNPQMPIGDLSGAETELTVPTPEAVTRRAREIALIHERDPEAFTDEDWREARRELTGVGAGASPDDPLQVVAPWSDRDAFPGDSGTQAPRLTPDDEEPLGERLVSRGVDEAAHDQMVAAGQEDQTTEG